MTVVQPNIPGIPRQRSWKHLGTKAEQVPQSYFFPIVLELHKCRYEANDCHASRKRITIFYRYICYFDNFFSLCQSLEELL